jgi:hypothetical protein
MRIALATVALLLVPARASDARSISSELLPRHPQSESSVVEIAAAYDSAECRAKVAELHSTGWQNVNPSNKAGLDRGQGAAWVHTATDANDVIYVANQKAASTFMYKEIDGLFSATKPYDHLYAPYGWSNPTDDFPPQGAVTAAETASCQHGILHELEASYQAETDGAAFACCPASCGSCSGGGCETRPGGSSQCCAYGLAESNEKCRDSTSVACIVPGGEAEAFARESKQGTSTAAETASCQHGILHELEPSYQAKTDGAAFACCPASCRSCSGGGCETRPGGSSLCCAYGLAEVNEKCQDSTSVACIVPGGQAEAFARESKERNSPFVFTVVRDPIKTAIDAYLEIGRRSFLDDVEEISLRSNPGSSSMRAAIYGNVSRSYDAWRRHDVLEKTLRASEPMELPPRHDVGTGGPEDARRQARARKATWWRDVDCDSPKAATDRFRLFLDSLEARDDCGRQAYHVYPQAMKVNVVTRSEASGGFGFSAIVKLEALEAGLAQVAQLAHTSPPVMPPPSKKEEHTTDVDKCSQLQLDEGLTRRLCKLYAADFVCFGYELPEVCR